MGLYQFRLPDIGEGVAEAEIATWHVKPGDLITEDQSIVDVMTDKATVDMSSPVSGRVLSITGEPGSFIAVGAVLVEIEVEGTGNVSGLVTEAKPQIEPESVSVPTSGAAPVTATPVVTEAPLASPSTRRKAREQGIDLAQVQGSGRGGRITPDDFDAFVALGAAVLFFSQFFINIGANIGILPVTGVTLPFVSYGGSSLIVNMALVGTVISLSKRYL